MIDFIKEIFFGGSEEIEKEGEALKRAITAQAKLNASYVLILEISKLINSKKHKSYEDEIILADIRDFIRERINEISN